MPDYRDNLKDKAGKDLNITVALPCYNEELTIVKVIKDFKSVLPEASICVFDNNSTDASAELAAKAGAAVYKVRKQGKGNVLRTIFDTASGDIIVLVDADDTYLASEVFKLLEPIFQGEADMVVGDRLKSASRSSLRQLHKFGNHAIVTTINFIFGTKYEDILSGYRVFTRRFIEEVPLLTSGFEIETELTLQALEHNFFIKEVPVSYKSRPLGSCSKLRTFQDGYRVMLTAVMLLRDHNPIRFFAFLSGLCLIIVFSFGMLRLMQYFGAVNLPAPFVTSIILLFAQFSVILLGIGFMLSAINSRFREVGQIIRRNRRNNV